MPTFPHAAVASPHYLATSAGVHVLRSGGNAVDAAVATNLVLAVVCPHLCGVGGDLFAIVHDGHDIRGLNSSGRLPMAATLPADGNVAERGIGSVTIPGAPAGWVALLQRFGSMSLSELAAPAIRYAREGFWPSPSLQRAIERSRPIFIDDSEFTRLFLVDGKIQNPELAITIEQLEHFYTGPVSRNTPPPFTADDFAAHKAEWVEPMQTPFAGVDIYEMPPNSRGHLVLRALERLEPLDGLGVDDAEFHRRLIRAIDTATLTGDTVYLCAQDENGMAVSVNESNYMGFGSGVVVPGTGVHLHNRGAYFTAPTYVGGERPVHTLSPGMALKDGKPHLLFGTMGGEAQIQIHLQLLARVLVLGEDPADAVAAPRWVKHGQGQLLAEEGLPDIGALKIERSDLAGHAHLILNTEQGLSAAADPRCDGLAGGY